MTIRILTGDCRHVLKTLPDECVHCVVTSPPYWGLRDYGNARWEGGEPGCDHLRRDPDVIAVNTCGLDGGSGSQRAAALVRASYGELCGKCGARKVDGGIGLEASMADWLEEMVALFREVRRVLRKDGTVWLNIGDAYSTNGYDARDTSAKGDAQPGGWDASRRGQGAADTARGSGLKPKQRLMLPARLALALQDDGWWLRDEVVWHKPNPMPSSVRDRTCPAHEMLYVLSRSPRYFYDQAAISEDASPNTHARLAQPTLMEQTGGPKQDLYESGITGQRARTRRPNEILQSMARKGGVNPKAASAPPGTRANGSFSEAISAQVVLKRNKRSVWTIPTEPFPGAHFATFPTSLVEPCVLAGTSSHGCCSGCGAPWVRELVDTGARVEVEDYDGAGRKDYAAAGVQNPSDVKRRVLESMSRVERSEWRPGCICGAPPGFRADDLEVIESPTYDDAGERTDLYADRTMEVGRAGMARPRRPGEGRRAMTRFEQRGYAEQLRASPHLEAMRAEAGEALEHYVRIDRSGARPVPPALLEAWLVRGWLKPVELPEWEPLPIDPCVVLDPFGGSGTTALVADRLHRDAVLVELNPTYAAMAADRLRAESTLFADVVVVPVSSTGNNPSALDGESESEVRCGLAAEAGENTGEP